MVVLGYMDGNVILNFTFSKLGFINLFFLEAGTSDYNWTWIEHNLI